MGKRTMEERASIDCFYFSVTKTYSTEGSRASTFIGSKVCQSLFFSVRYKLLSAFVTYAFLPAFVVASFSFPLATAGCAPPLPQFWLPSHAEFLPALVSQQLNGLSSLQLQHTVQFLPEAVPEGGSSLHKATQIKWEGSNRIGS